MQFLGISPSIFWPLLLGLSAAVVVMYLFKLRRRRVQVPYSALWQRLLAERQVRSLWHRIKRLLSLLLQLAVLALICVALLDPRPADFDTEGRSVLLIVDTSASMATTDLPAGEDRIEAARRAALDVFDELGGQDSLMVVRADGQLRPLTPFVTPSGLVRELLTGLEVTATRADLPGAISFAARALAGRTRPELVLVTDGAYSAEVLEAAAAVELPAGTRVRAVQVGESGGNLAVTAFNVRRYPADRRHFEVYLEVTSSFDVPVTAELNLVANGVTIDRQLLALPPHESVSRTFPNLARGGSRLEARLILASGDAVDRFPVDDVAYALLPEEEPLRVLLVSPPNLFVEAPLMLNQNLELTVWRPSEYDEASLGAFDVVVFNEFAPPPPAQGGFLYIHPNGDDGPWPVQGRVANPIIDRFERGDPLMRWLHGFRSVNIADALRLGLGDGDVAIARSIEGEPMFVRRAEPTRRLAGVAFALDASDFALRIAYPVFVLNAIDWLAGEDATLVESYRTGQAARVSLGPVEASAAWVVPQDRAEASAVQRAEVVSGSVTFYPDFPGFYDIILDDGRHADAESVAEAAAAGDLRPDRVVAANLADVQESEITPADTLPFPTSSEAEQAELAGLLEGTEPWLLLVLAAVALLLLEWVTFNRRVTV